MIRPRLVGRPDPDNVYALDHGALPLIEWMQRTGMLVDTKAMSDLGADITLQLEQLSRQIYKLAGREFNISSDEQLAELLFSKKSVGGLGIDPKYIKRTKKTRRPSVRADELAKVISSHQIVRPLIEFKHLEHLMDCFVVKLPKFIQSDGRVHGDFLTTRVETGRLAVKNPPLMQIPVRTEIGKRIRAAFIAGDGCKLLSVDQSQIEMRVEAHSANDPSMIQCFLDKDDLHWRTAEAVYGKPRDQLTKSDHRDPCKNVGFGIMYGLQAPGLRNQIIARGGDAEKWTLDECQALIEKWFSLYPRVRERMEEQYYRVRRYGFVWDMFGRIRHLPEVRSLKPYIVGEGLRAAGNFEIQSGAQGLMKMAMHRDEIYALCEAYEEAGKTCKPVLQIHDEVLLEVEEDIIEEVGEFVKDIICGIAQLRVPIDSSCSTGDNWSQLK